MEFPHTPVTVAAGSQPTRRQLLGQGTAFLAASAWCSAAWAQGMAHAPMGPVEPRQAVPGLTVTLHTGASAALAALLKGKITALQLMFTGCSSICPVQGAVFASLQQRLADQAPPNWQLLSFSIDPLGDDARALAAWRQRHNAGQQWLAAVPEPRHADRLPDFLGSRPAPGKSADRHTAQVYLVDRQGRLAFRMAELASADAIARAVRELARRDA